jgi:GSH-dependent disulfide-bond oxidoreductase
MNGARAMELYGCMTPNVLKAMFMLGELDLPFTLNHVRVWRGEQFRDGFERLHPYRKLPVLVDPDGGDPGADGGCAPLTIFESGAILIYLAEKSGRLLGETAVGRSAVMQWLMLQMSSVGPAFGNASHFVRVPGPAQAYSRSRFVTQAARLCALYDERLRQARFVAGEHFSIADVATFPWLWKHPGMIGIDTSGYAGLNRWIEEVAARDGLHRVHERYKAMVRIDRDDLAEIDSGLRDRIMGRGAWALPHAP